MSEPASRDKHPDAAAAHPRRRPPRWGIALLVGSFILMAAGIAIPYLMGDAPAPAVAARTGPPLPPGAAGLVGGSSESAGAEPADSSKPSSWSPAVFRLGFSFVVGFAIAYALRSFFKLAILFAGFFALALFGLQYAGLIDVRWGAIEQQYDTASHWLGGQFESVKAFVTGYLPSAGAATAGLSAGFLRRA